MKHFEGFERTTNKNIILQYIDAIVFRYVFGIGDLAKRNFIIKNEKLYSIDEDSANKDFSLEGNMKSEYSLFLENLKKNKDILEKYKKYNNSRLQNLIKLLKD